jgi:hypothetical protein
MVIGNEEEINPISSTLWTDTIYIDYWFHDAGILVVKNVQHSCQG